LNLHQSNTEGRTISIAEDMNQAENPAMQCDVKALIIYVTGYLLGGVCMILAITLGPQNLISPLGNSNSAPGWVDSTCTVSSFFENTRLSRRYDVYVATSPSLNVSFGAFDSMFGAPWYTTTAMPANVETNLLNQTFACAIPANVRTSLSTLRGGGVQPGDAQMAYLNETVSDLLAVAAQYRLELGLSVCFGVIASLLFVVSLVFMARWVISLARGRQRLDARALEERLRVLETDNTSTTAARCAHCGCANKPSSIVCEKVPCHCM
jgi:hypothetical protein